MDNEQRDREAPHIPAVDLGRAYDHIWYAVPYFELQDFCLQNRARCCSKSSSEVQECAYEVVRKAVCICHRDEDQMIQAVGDEIVRQLQREYVKAGCNRNR
ncbi:MAG: hypothetical protein J5J00_02210 [Deltaproteobacteria bacterium]|nr:hypothetical protein [Deltaproteobacteria bacterium]